MFLLDYEDNRTLTWRKQDITKTEARKFTHSIIILVHLLPYLCSYVEYSFYSASFFFYEILWVWALCERMFSIKFDQYQLTFLSYEITQHTNPFFKLFPLLDDTQKGCAGDKICVFCTVLVWNTFPFGKYLACYVQVTLMVLVEMQTGFHVKCLLMSNSFNQFGNCWQILVKLLNAKFHEECSTVFEFLYVDKQTDTWRPIRTFLQLFIGNTSKITTKTTYKSPVCLQWIIWHHIPENRAVHNYHYENLKFYKDDIITQIFSNQHKWREWQCFFLENIFITSKQREIFVDFLLNCIAEKSAKNGDRICCHIQNLFLWKCW
jgi:hypothetical protein